MRRRQRCAHRRQLHRGHKREPWLISIARTIARERGTAQSRWLTAAAMCASLPQAHTCCLTATPTAVLIVSGNMAGPCPHRIEAGATVCLARTAERRLIGAGCRRAGLKAKMCGRSYAGALWCRRDARRIGTLHERAAMRGNRLQQQCQHIARTGRTCANPHSSALASRR
ncbi:hypothetical protein C8R47DRAFT_1108709 [Mycena vitilis]|nr:hypothetical protein C8R47DRAFT_1171333 [Mycena vitilis]KAJ6501034.1 hypothetical protein C8R47DRAFT_1108709 [Mycena vitilis]